MKQLLHFHVWVVKEKLVIDSPLKACLRTGKVMDSYNGDGLIGKMFITDRVLVTYVCKNCPAEKVEEL